MQSKREIDEGQIDKIHTDTHRQTQTHTDTHAHTHTDTQTDTGLFARRQSARRHHRHH